MKNKTPDIKKRAKWSRTKKRVVVYLSILTVIFAGVGSLISGDSFRGWLADQSRRQIEVILGEDVRVASAEFHASDLSLELIGVEVESEHGVLFHAESVRANSSIFGGKPEMELVRPVGEVWIVDGVLRDFPGLEWAARGERSGLPFKELTIVDGEFELVIVQGGAERRLLLSGVNLQTADLSGDLGFTEVMVQLPDRDVIDLSGVHFGHLGMSDESLSLTGLTFEEPDFQLEASVGASISRGLFGEIEVRVLPQIMDRFTKEDWTFTGDITYTAALSGMPSAPVVDGVVTGDLEWKYGQGIVPKVFLFEKISGGLQISNQGGLEFSEIVGEYGGGELLMSAAIAKGFEVERLSLSFTQCEFDRVIGATIGHPAPWVDFDADATVALSGSLLPFELSGEISIDAQNATVWGAPDREADSLMLSFPHLSASGLISARTGALELDLNHVRSDHSDVSIRSLLEFGENSSIQAFFSTNSLYLPDLAPLGGLALQGYGAVQGSFERSAGRDPVVSADVSFTNFGALGYQFIDRVEAHMEAINYSPLSITEISADVGDSEFTGRLRYDFGSDEPLALDIATVDGRIEDVLPHFSPVRGVDGSLYMSLHLEGAPRALSGRFDSTMSDLSLWGERYTVGEANGTMELGEFSLSKLLIQREEGSSSIMARGQITEGWAINGELLVDAMAIPEQIVGAGLVDGTIQVDAIIGGTLQAPEPNGRVAWRDAAIHGHTSGDGELAFSTVEGVLVVDGALLGGALELSGSLSLEDEREFQVEASGASLPLSLVFSESANGERVWGEFSGGLATRGSLGRGVDEVSAFVESGGLRWRDQSLTTAGRWIYKSDNNGSIVEGVHVIGDGVDITLSGSTMGGAGWSVDGGGAVDLSWLPMVAPTVQVAHGGGEISVESSPELLLALDIHGGTLRADWFPHSLNDISGRVVADASGVQFEEVTGSIGGGAVTVSGGVQSGDWSPYLVGINLGLVGSSVKLFDSLPTLTGNGELELAGPWPFGDAAFAGSDLLLSGDIELTDALFTERLDWEEWLLDFRQSVEFEQVAVSDESGLVAFNIAVVGEGAGRLRNNIAEGVCDVDLVVVGDTDKPGVTGVVRMHSGGSVVLQDRQFELLRGELRYIDPYSFDPELNLLMRTEIESRDESYRIEYHIDGPLSDWYSSAVSTPSLSQADINALLLFGLTRDDLERFGGVNSALLMEGADILLHGIGLDNRALDTIGGGVAIFDRVELVTGASERGSQVASETRVMLEKHLEAPYSTDMRFEFNPLRTAENTLELERELSDGIYVTIFRSSMEQDRSLDIGGAYGVDFKMRWDVE